MSEAPVTPPADTAPIVPPSAPAAAPPATAVSGGWFGETPEDKAWAESKGWTPDADPKDLLPKVTDSYKNLEKLFGADRAGRTVMLPKDASDTETANTLYTRLGKPDSPDKYEIVLPDGADTSFADSARAVFHKNHFTTDQAKGVTEWYQAMELDAIAKHQQFVKDQVEGLKKEWGTDFDRNVEVGRAAAKAANISEETLQRFEGQSPAEFLKMMTFFGQNYIEASPPGQESRSAPNFDGMTPAAAEAKVNQLRADPNFMARYDHQDPKIREEAMWEMDRLERIAYNAKRR